MVGILRGRLGIARQLELPGDVRRLPVHSLLGEDLRHLGSPVAVGLGLVVEEADDGLAEVVLEAIVVGLVDRPEEPVHAVLAGTVDEDLAGPVRVPR